MTISIRSATPDDMEAVQQIYAHHVLNGTGTFEEVPPDLAEMQRRLGTVLANDLPWLVAESDGEINGYAYAQRYHARSAYRRTLEDSVYVRPSLTGAGIGTALLGELIARCTALGYREMIAVIGDSGNAGSIRLHEGLGFTRAGLLQNVGYKFDRYLNVMLMQKSLA